jgi:hypothetical protein
VKYQLKSFCVFSFHKIIVLLFSTMSINYFL